VKEWDQGPNLFLLRVHFVTESPFAHEVTECDLSSQLQDLRRAPRPQAAEPGHALPLWSHAELSVLWAAGCFEMGPFMGVAISS
jgi:hypothetical protein